MYTVIWYCIVIAAICFVVGSLFNYMLSSTKVFDILTTIAVVFLTIAILLFVWDCKDIHTGYEETVIDAPIAQQESASAF